MQKKYIIILSVTLGIIILSTALALKSPAGTNLLPIAPSVNPAGQSPAYNEPPIDVVPSAGFPLGTPSSTPKAVTAAVTSDTGALLVAPPTTQRQAYEELFALLDRGTIVEKGFTINPIPVERKIIIYLDAPLEDTLSLATEWLAQEGYGHIPKENIRYIEK